jgi:hypothetical protein
LHVVWFFFIDENQKLWSLVQDVRAIFKEYGQLSTDFIQFLLRIANGILMLLVYLSPKKWELGFNILRTTAESCSQFTRPQACQFHYHSVNRKHVRLFHLSGQTICRKLWYYHTLKPAVYMHTGDCTCHTFNNILWFML